MPTLSSPGSASTTPASEARAASLFSRGPFVRVMTVVIIAVVIAMMSLVFWRWLTVVEPSSAVVIQGDQTLDDAKIVVQGYDRGKIREWNATLNAGNAFQTPVLLQPGHYTVEVTHHGRLVLKSSFTVDPMLATWYALNCAVPLVGSDSLGDTQVKIEGQTLARTTVALDAVDLNAQNQYRTVLYLAPGDYHVTALKSGRVLAHEDFSVRRGMPVKIDLVRVIARPE